MRCGRPFTEKELAYYASKIGKPNPKGGHNGLLNLGVRRYKLIYPHLADDIESIGRAALAQAIAEYNPETAPRRKPNSKLPLKFSTYAVNQVRWAVQVYLYGGGAGKRGFVRYDATTDPLSTPVGKDKDGDNLTLAEVIDKQNAEHVASEGIAKENRFKRIADLREVIEELCSPKLPAGTRLTKREKQVVKYYLSRDGNAAEVGRILGYSRMMISKYLAAIVGKIKCRMESRNGK